MFRIDASSIDKSLPVPVGTQLYGLLNYALGFGIPYGTKLQSVRQLAAELGIAPMTVAQVYQRLRDEGLIEMRQGLGAFAAAGKERLGDKPPPALALRPDIELLISKAERLGISTTALVSMISAQSMLRRPVAGLRIVFVGIFEGPTRDYVQQIKQVLSVTDKVELLMLDTLKVSEEARGVCRSADLVLTFLHREAELRALVPDAEILALKFIPSEKTRQALAGLDPRARVAAVTHLRDYIAIMRPSVLEFAPHVSNIRVTWSLAPDIQETLDTCDAVIFATGADHIADMARPGVRCFEFRHAPDPGALENVLMPYLAELRQRRIARNDRSADGAPPAATKEHA
ncbi:MAG TPA: GntR family transcriptional regulator [Devosia sp.]|nr:GntR family transcriptional regulator [Devosia sp.]